MESSGATPISLTQDSCSANENRCHIGTPAPPTPFPYSPMSPYGAINPFSFMSRYSSAGAAHLQSAFSSPMASSLPGLAYPTDIYHYNPYSALTPTSPLTPSSFWSLTAQQSYHQLNGITFGPSGPVSYNTNAHLFNIFSPNSLSPMSPSPDLLSPSFYPRVSSMPSPYSSSPGLSSAFMSPSSMPLLLSPSLSSSVDRPPTYLSDNTSTPSTTPSMTPSIKCEPIEHNCSSHQTSHMFANNFSDFNDKIDSIERHTERADKSHERHTKKHSNNNSINSKLTSKEPTDQEIKRHSLQKTITTTITPSKTREKHSARVEPLMRSTDDTTNCVVLNGRRDVTIDLKDKTAEPEDHKQKTCEASPIKAVPTNIDESPDKDRIKDDIIKDNKDLKSMNAKVKRELIECDMSLPSVTTTDSVPNCSDITSDSNASDVIANNTSESGSKTIDNKLIDDNSQMDDKNLIIDDNSNSNSNDHKEVNNCHKNIDSKTLSNSSKQSKDAKRESQLKQLQSYRKESHRMNGNKPSVNTIQSQPLNGIESNAAISIVLPKSKDQSSGQHLTPLSVKLVNQSPNQTNQSKASPLSACNPPNNVLSSNSESINLTSTEMPVTNAVQNRVEPKAQSVMTCRTKPVPKISVNNSSANPIHQKPALNVEKTATVSPNQINGHKLPQTNTATKQLPKKPRISQKTPSASIPVGIAIAQQRTSPKNKSLDSNASQPLKPILPTLSLPVMANSPILITDSPPAGTSLWIKPTSNSTLSNNTSIQNNSQFSLTGDYQLARDSLTGHLYLIRNSSSLPTTPTTTPKPQTIISPLTIKSSEHQSKSSPSAILTLPMGTAQPQQFFANLGQTQASTLILDTSNSAPLMQIATTAPVTNLTTTNSVKYIRHFDPKDISSVKNTETIKSSLNVERGCQASISDDELTCDNMKTTATQVDMDSIHSSEEDDDNEGKRHKLRIFSERKNKSFEKDSSVDEDESSRDSVHLQIVDETADEPPQLPVKSAPVMQFIDHHGLDLLVDSIEEFAARGESDPPPNDLSVNGLQLLSTLAEQRALEERSVNDSSALRRHSADSHITTNGLNFNNKTTDEFNALKRRQRSESCFTSNPIKFDENEELFSDIKKLMKTSGCQTDDRRISRIDNSLTNIRRSERIFINDSVVSNGKDVTTDVNKDKDLLSGKELKKKDCSEHKCKVISMDSKAIFSEKNVSNIEQTVKAKPKDQYVFTDTKSDHLFPNLNKFPIINNKTKTNDSLVFCDIIKTNNQKIGSDLSIDSNKFETTEHKKIKKKKKKNKLLSTSNPLEKSSFDGFIGEKRVKKRKKRSTEEEEENKKKLKTDYDKQIDDSIETIIKRVSEIDESIDDSLFEYKPNVCVNKEAKIICEEVIKTNENKVSDEQKDIFKKKRPLVKTCFELYDQKRMRLLDETIDEVIAKQSVPPEEQIIKTNDITNVELITTEIRQLKTPPPLLAIATPPIVSKEGEEPPKLMAAEPPKPQTPPKPFLKQPSISSIASTTSTTSSVSESCNSTTPSLHLRLSESDLDLKLNVIMLVDGLLFVGEICPIQPPDIYGIILHGERQHRPIIYSQEEMLNEAIREVKPTLEELEEGQRVCAYWSTQYRHLYPGFVRSSSPHPNLVFVEFDDGDNGRISIDDIRLLPQDYPQMKINADPLKNLERRRRMSSCGKDNRKQNSDNSFDNKIEEKKNLTEEMPKTIKNKSNEESKTNSINDSNKKEKISKNKSNKCCNTSSDKPNPSHESSKDKLASKPDIKKKKKKHNKEDRHHRHHHNHKHHHCRHHKRCKKHKKSKDENSSSSSSGSPNSLHNDSNDKTDKSGENMTKPFRVVAVKSTPKEIKPLDHSNDAQNGSVDNHNDSSKTTISSTYGDNNDKNRTPLKTVIKKTAKQRALDRLQTNLSESFLTITSPVRKRYTNENKDSSVSTPSPKKRERMPSAEKSKIAAFLPERQLWHWSGKYIRRTGNKGSRTRKVYYREIERGREHIRVDDCAVFLSTGRPHLPYIGRIDSMWQTGSGTMIVKVRWFYHPEETKGQPVPLFDKRGALFESSHFDVNDVQTISHKCQVISWTEYQEKLRENPLMVTDDPPNVYYSAGQYDALAGHVKMDTTVPLKDNKPKDQICDKSDKTETKT